MIEDFLLGSFFGAFAGIMILIVLGVYIYFSLALMNIAKRKKVPHAWLSFIPIGNVWVMVRTAGLNGWWTLAIFAGFVPVIGQLAVLIGYAYVWYLIADKLKFNPFLGILMVIPLVNLIMIGIFSWGKP